MADAVLVFDHEDPRTPFALRAALRRLAVPPANARLYRASAAMRFLLVLDPPLGTTQFLPVRDLDDAKSFVPQLLSEYALRRCSAPTIDCSCAPAARQAIAEALTRIPSAPPLPPAG